MTVVNASRWSLFLLLWLGLGEAFILPSPPRSAVGKSYSRGGLASDPSSACPATRRGGHQGHHQEEDRITRRQSAGWVGLGSLAASFLPFLSLLPASAAAPATTYYPQVQAGYQTLLDLIKAWPAISRKGDGDEVRRYLGTVGTKSPLWKLDKAFAGIQDALISEDTPVVDPLDFAEASGDVLAALREAEYLAYSANFAGYGNGGGGTDYLEESRQLVEKSRKLYAKLLKLLKLEVPS